MSPTPNAPGLSAQCPSAQPLSAHLTLIIDHLCRTVAARAGRNRGFAPLVLLLWPYLRRLAARFDSLVKRLGENRLAAHSAHRPPRRAQGPRKPLLPGGFAWLIRLAPETAPFGSQLRHMLADPAFADLLAAAPQAGRIFRPLCRMLGVEPGPDIPAALFPSPPAPTAIPERMREAAAAIPIHPRNISAAEQHGHKAATQPAEDASPYRPP